MIVTVAVAAYLACAVLLAVDIAGAWRSGGGDRPRAVAAGILVGALWPILGAAAAVFALLRLLGSLTSRKGNP